MAKKKKEIEKRGIESAKTTKRVREKGRVKETVRKRRRRGKEESGEKE